ncbi:MAG: CdaR family protein [Desulfobacterales bacterium]|jgi:YbbR domain-containing protein|nr:CdaR family protein [Desulfobacterales bacterium]MDD3081761.1 CdaR family protein [Desulfobacterales bacterium]MDD3950769.1 CdaR family protein [Desulfobacterales bacterium]MDY0377499.1 CdaR family protein [Desulfobacterales bacterium]
MDERAGKPIEHVRFKFIFGFIAGVLFFLGALAVGYQFSGQTVDVFIPLHLVRISKDLTPAGPMLKGIEVRLQGPRFVVSRLGAAESAYDLDLSDASEGAVIRDLRGEQLRIPAGLSILSMQPDRVTVHLEKQIQKQIPVIACLYGRPAAGFTIDGFTVKPPMVTLRGAQSILSSIQSVSSKPIRVDGLSESFQLEIVLDITEGLERVDGQGTLSAEIGIVEQMLIKKFSGLPVIGKEAGYRYAITPEYVDITVQGPFRHVSALLPDKDISLTLMLKDLKPGVYVRRANIGMPVGISLVDVKPELFTARITNEKLRESQP